MTIKSASAWSLIILAVAVAFCLTVKPFILKPPLQEVAVSALLYSGEDSEGEGWYYVFQTEAKEWVTILSPLLPMVIACLGIFIGRRKNENKRR